NIRVRKKAADPRSLSPLRRLFAQERTLVVVCTILGASVGLYRLGTVPPQYAATARLYVEPADAMGNVAAAGVESGKTVSVASPPSDLLLGTEVSRLAVELGNLESLPCFAGVADLPLQIASQLEVKTSAPQSGPGQIQDLRYTCGDRKAAEQVLENVISAYAIAAERWRSQRITESLAALEKQRKLLLDRLQQKQSEVRRLQEADPAAFNAGDSLVLDSRLKALVDARIRAEIRRIEAEVRLATLQAVGAPGSHGGEAATRPAEAAFDGAALDSWISRAGFDAGSPDATAGLPAPFVPAAESLTRNAAMHAGRAMADGPPAADIPPAADGIDLDAEARYVQRLEQAWGPDHPKLQAAKARLADLERRARRQAGQSIRMAEAYFRYCRDEEERLQRAIDAQRSALTPGTAGEAALQARILQQVVDRSSKLLAVVCERIDHLNLEAASAAVAGIKITTVVPPNAAPVATGDQSPRLFLVPTGIGLLIGFALMYLRGPGSGARASGSGSGGSVRYPGRTGHLHEADRQVARACDAVLGWVASLPVGAGRGAQRGLGTWVLRESDSAAARALRRLGKRILRAASRARVRCILVTSAGPREGKSVVLANVATAIAQTGRRVLLVDANFDHPSQHVLLSDILSLGEPPATGAEPITIDALEGNRVGVRTQIETLRVVPAWPRPARPREIIESAAFGEFVRRSAAEYDLVLIDAPSLTRPEEVEILAEATDAVIYVESAANASWRTPREVCRRLRQPALGVIVNAFAIQAARSDPPAGRVPKRRAARRGTVLAAQGEPELDEEAVSGSCVGSESPSEPST
ncbi:MAG: hypothetical protein ACPMAQ_11485, partial [Phycisphaerae bacterium]